MTMNEETLISKINLLVSLQSKQTQNLEKIIKCKNTLQQIIKNGDLLPSDPMLNKTMLAPRRQAIYDECMIQFNTILPVGYEADDEIE